MPEEKNAASLSDDQSPNPENSSQGNQIPDWMKDAGWETDTGAFDESKPVFDDLEDVDEIVPAEIPAWLEEAAPEGFSLDADITDEKSASIIDDDDIPISPLMDGFKELPDKDETLEEQDPIDKDEPIVDVPSWLKNLELDEDSQETAVAWLENMPESLRATDEERSNAGMTPRILDDSDETVDELDWLDEQFNDEQKTADNTPVPEAKLSEDLVASDLIPEQQEGVQLFHPEEIDTADADVPSWLDDLSSDEATKQTSDIPSEIADAPVSIQTQIDADIDEVQERDSESLMPDWLSEVDSEEKPAEIADDGRASDPEWLSEFEGTTDEPPAPGDAGSLDWLESLGETQSAAEDEIESITRDIKKTQPQIDDHSASSRTDSDVSSSDDTLNTEYPDWLANIGRQEKDSSAKEAVAPDEFEESSNWLDQLGDTPFEETAQTGEPQEDSEVLEWLNGIDASPERESVTAADELRDSLTGDLVEEVSVTTEPTEEQKPLSEELPDWLGELETENQDDPSSLENALRQSDHQRSDEEVQFLDRAEEEQEDNSDWLAKLDITEDPDQSDSDTPAIKVDVPQEIESAPDPEPSTISGGILERLKDPEQETADPDVPQWLENLKKEEDPQETAILWLQQFVERGTTADIHDEIKRYTDELDPGDTVPKWMEDLKHEEDPQTTAMLWLEKLSGARETSAKKPPRVEPDESGWLAELEKEAADQPEEIIEEPISQEFQDTNEGWLDDLDLDEKINTKVDEDPDWTQPETQADQVGETPPWMKATSPLDGDFYTDELAGSQEKEVEIPDWLAGYAEGERPQEPDTEDSEGEVAAGDDYTWVAAGDNAQRTSREPIDLNTAAISQLESIIGISYQVAKGIVTYREKNGPYRKLEDLLQVPEISDEQTIEILKPEVEIKKIKEKAKPKKKTSPVVEEPPEKRLGKARELIAERQIEQALEHYEYLIIKKKSIDDVIEDLTKASIDHPMDVALMKTLGDAYMRLDKLEEALDAYSKAEDLLR